jgi:hypothetical protein
MGEKTIVVTMYGKNESIESISISLFDKTAAYYPESKNSAFEYCNNINNLELKDPNWICASVVGENKKIILEKPPEFDIINQLDDRALQKVLRAVSGFDLAKALKGIDEKTRDQVFKNMSKRAAAMLKEDIEALRGVSRDDIRSSRKKIIDIIRRLTRTGEIVMPD